MTLRAGLQNTKLDFKATLSVVLFILLMISVYKLYEDRMRFEYYETIVAQNQEQIQILRDEKYKISLRTPTPMTVYSENKKLYAPANFDFTLNCTNDGYCEITESDGFANIYVDSVGWFTSTKVDTKALNNPNYTSVLKWYDDLLHKDPKAAGKNLDPMYGTVSVEGTDAYTYPFYTRYDVNSVSAYIFGKNPGLIVKTEDSYNTDFLIPQGNSIYRFFVTTSDERSLESMKEVLSTIQFTK